MTKGRHEMSDDVKALIAEARTPAYTMGLFGRSPADADDFVRRLADALEAAQQAPAVDREALARELFIADNWGVPSGGADWDEGRVHESRIAQMYRLADGLVASGILQDAAEIEARGLEKAADIMGMGEGRWLRVRAQQVREGNA